MLLLFGFAQASSHLETYRVDGVARQALVYPGTGAIPRTGRPIVFAFHGHGGTMNSADGAFSVETRWPQATIVYPQGIPTSTTIDPGGNLNGWQLNPGDEGDRDLKFIDAILAAAPNIDRSRVFAMGHSNGARFVYVLWAARGDVFAAYGPSAMSATDLVGQLRPASFFATAGQRDPLVPFADQLATIQSLAALDGANLAKAQTTGYVSTTTGRDGLQVGTFFFPGGHVYPAEAIDATLALFKRSTQKKFHPPVPE